jgi:hypothetical protein
MTEIMAKWLREVWNRRSGVLLQKERAGFRCFTGSVNGVSEKCDNLSRDLLIWQEA